MSHTATHLQWGGYKQILAPSPQARPYSPFPVQLSLVWSLLYKFGDCTRLAEDKADTTNLSLALALVLVKPWRLALLERVLEIP